MKLIRRNSLVAKLIAYVPGFWTEAARVGSDTETWVRVMTANTPHECRVRTPDRGVISHYMYALPGSFNVHVLCAYEPFPQKDTRVWRLTGTRSELERAVEQVYKLDARANLELSYQPAATLHCKVRP